MLYYITSWRLQFVILCALLALVAFVVATMLPESPFFFAGKGKVSLCISLEMMHTRYFRTALNVDNVTDYIIESIVMSVDLCLLMIRLLRVYDG